uniref:Uncharacterized protein n=1 Tax=Pipistrellus kuhlii TaxID=59472 RepID=A0A7J7XVA8_PIPKU|nr:hypothetical protein mPipKuh1_010505 [Pipistrellus kuhlii]
MSLVLGFSSVGSGIGGGVQSSLEPLSPSRQGNSEAQPAGPSLHAVCAPPGPPFAASPESRLTARVPMDEPGSLGSGLELGFRAVGAGPSTVRAFLSFPLGTASQALGLPPLLLCPLRAPRVSVPWAFTAPPRFLLVFSLLLVVEFPVSRLSCSSG